MLVACRQLTRRLLLFIGQCPKGGFTFNDPAYNFSGRMLQEILNTKDFLAADWIPLCRGKLISPPVAE